MAAAAYIVAMARTAGGKKGGKLAAWHPADLAAEILNALVDRVGCDPALVEDVILGCVMQVGEQAVNIARSAVLASRFPDSVPAASVDRQCGSSQQALQFAAQAIMSGTQDIVIAGGVESMTRVPMGLSATLPAKSGFGFYKSPRIEARYPGIQFSQFMGAEMMAKKYDISKEDMDQYALQSHRKAVAATHAAAFKDEIVPIEVTLPDGMKEMHTIDEGIRFDANIEDIRSVKPLTEGGGLTAATASQICDGASGVMMASEAGLKALNAKPLARIVHVSVLGHDPVIMLEAPIPATKRALKKADLKIDEIDLYEVNEAFAPVPIAWLRETGGDPGKHNVNGGAIALGHPLGASGTKLMTTLVNALHKRNKKYGLQTMCEGGGQANVTIIERV
jgi:acetyl-CoA C-acetyltransferase